jgi:hypothetical protein
MQTASFGAPVHAGIGPLDFDLRHRLGAEEVSQRRDGEDGRDQVLQSEETRCFLNQHSGTVQDRFSQPA